MEVGQEGKAKILSDSGARYLPFAKLKFFLKRNMTIEMNATIAAA